jgi:hypothetical protein
MNLPREEGIITETSLRIKAEWRTGETLWRTGSRGQLPPTEADRLSGKKVSGFVSPSNVPLKPKTVSIADSVWQPISLKSLMAGCSTRVSLENMCEAQI